MRYAILTLSFLALVGCTTAPAPKGGAAAGEGPAFRYLAWLEGEFQTDYEPNRELAARRMKRWEGAPPNPEDTEEYLEYLSLLDASGRGDAEAKIKAYLAAKPDEKRAVFLLGVHYMRKRNPDLAAYFFTQLEKESDFSWKSLLYNNLGMLALRDGNRVLAMDYFEKALGASPRIAAPYANLGAIHLQARNYSKAADLFGTAVQIDDGFEDAALGLGSAQEGQGKFEDAWKTYARFMDRNPEAVSVLYNASLVLGNRLNRKAEAEELMRRYISRGGKETAGAQKMLQIWR